MVGDFVIGPDGQPNLGFFLIMIPTGAWVLSFSWAFYRDWDGVGTWVARKTTPESLSIRTRRLLVAFLGFGLGTIGIMVGIVGTILKLAGQ